MVVSLPPIAVFCLIRLEWRRLKESPFALDDLWRVVYQPRKMFRLRAISVEDGAWKVKLASHLHNLTTESVGRLIGSRSKICKSAFNQFPLTSPTLKPSKGITHTERQEIFNNSQSRKCMNKHSETIHFPSLSRSWKVFPFFVDFYANRHLIERSVSVFPRFCN